MLRSCSFGWSNQMVHDSGLKGLDMHDAASVLTDRRKAIRVLGMAFLPQTEARKTMMIMQKAHAHR